MWLHGVCCKWNVRGTVMWQSPVPNQYEDNNLSARLAHDAFVCRRDLNLPSFHSRNRQREQKVLGAYGLSGVKKNPLCWYWFLLSCGRDMFSHCRHACTVQQTSVFGNLERSCCEGPPSWWWCGWMGFVQSQQKDSETVVKHGGPVVLSGVTQEQDGLLAGGQHIAPQPLSAPAHSPLHPEVLSSAQNKEPELARTTNNFTISCKLGIKSSKNDKFNIKSCPQVELGFIYLFLKCHRLQSDFYF